MSDNPADYRRFGDNIYGGDMQDLELLDALRDCGDTWTLFDEEAASGSRVQAVRQLVACGLIEEQRVIEYRPDGGNESLRLTLTRSKVAPAEVAQKRIVDEFPPEWKRFLAGGGEIHQREIRPMRIRLTADGRQEIADLSCTTAPFTQAFKYFIDKTCCRGAFASGHHLRLNWTLDAVSRGVVQDEPAGGITTELDVETRACAVLQKHPDWTKTKIATEIGCHVKYLSDKNLKRFAAAWKAAKDSRRRSPKRGSKSKDGTVEAVGDVGIDTDEIDRRNKWQKK